MLHTFNPVSPAARPPAGENPAPDRRWGSRMGDGWAGKEGCVTSRKDVHPARGSERKRIERQHMSIEVAGRHRQCATRTHEDGILRRHCKRCAVAVGTVLMYPLADTRHGSLKVWSSGTWSTTRSFPISISFHQFRSGNAGVNPRCGVGLRMC